MRVDVSDSKVLVSLLETKNCPKIALATNLNNDVLETQLATPCATGVPNTFLYAIGKPQTLPLNDTLGALTDQGLVGVDSDANHTGFVVCEGRNLITSAVSHKEHPGAAKNILEQQENILEP